MTKQMDLEGITLSDMSDRERQIVYVLTYKWKLNNETKQVTKQNRVHKYR